MTTQTLQDKAEGIRIESTSVAIKQDEFREQINIDSEYFKGVGIVYIARMQDVKFGFPWDVYAFRDATIVVSSNTPNISHIRAYTSQDVSPIQRIEEFKKIIEERSKQ